MLLGWFRRWLHNRRRMIYRFWDGTRYRAVDPIDIHLKLQSHPTYNAQRHLREIDEGDVESTRVTCQAVQDVFCVQPYNSNTKRGLTVGEQLGLLADFYFWIEDQKKSISHSLTPPLSTELEASPTSSEPTTPDTADCTSTANAPTCDTPTGCDTPLTPH